MGSYSFIINELSTQESQAILNSFKRVLLLLLQLRLQLQCIL